MLDTWAFSERKIYENYLTVLCEDEEEKEYLSMSLIPKHFPLSSVWGASSCQIAIFNCDRSKHGDIGQFKALCTSDKANSQEISLSLSNNNPRLFGIFH